jgi:Tfp pilus assembly protein PilN
MITINLKPGARRTRGASPLVSGLARAKALGQQVKDPYRLGALVLGTAWLGWVGFSHLTASAEAADLEPKLEQARAENHRFRAFLGEKRRLESVRDSIQAQIRTIKHVDGDRYVWPHIMDEVARAVPAYTWLTEISVQAAAPVATSDSTGAFVEPPPVQVQVTGRTVDLQGYTRLLRQLEDSPWLRDVTAISANTVLEQERAVTAFVLRATYERLSGAAPAGAPSDSSRVVQAASIAPARGN